MASSVYKSPLYEQSSRVMEKRNILGFQQIS